MYINKPTPQTENVGVIQETSTTNNMNNHKTEKYKGLGNWGMIISIQKQLKLLTWNDIMSHNFNSSWVNGIFSTPNCTKLYEIGDVIYESMQLN